MSDVSVQIWIVVEFGHEYTDPIKAWDKKWRAELHKKRLEETIESRRHKLPPDFLGYRLKRIPFIRERTF